jgi:hypothetical protein
MSFSQNDTIPKAISLKVPVVRLVIKDLMLGDRYVQEILIKDDKIFNLNQKIILQDSIINLKNNQIQNYKLISQTFTQQISTTNEIITQLNVKIKKQKIKNKLTSGVGLITVLGVILLLN